MSSEYSYDEEGQFFPFFIVTVAGLVTIPVTYSLLRKSTDLENTAPRIKSSFQPEHADLIDGHRRKQKRRERKHKRMIAALVGWAMIAYMVYLMSVTARSTPKIWNPYEILDVPMSATEKQIQSRYRKLSITLHPDKARPDPAKNETLESINEHWVEVIKAYKALTDEEIRNNYIQYGNPDGRQSTSFGIALPQFLVTEGNGKYILLVYGSLLGVLLPYFVGKWWYGSQKVTKEKVLVKSAGNMFKEYNERADRNNVVKILSSGAEFEEILHGHKADAGSGQLEKRILADGETTLYASGMTAKDRDRLQDIDDATRRKALALLWAYLGRVELDDKVLNDEKFEVAPTALALNEAFTTIALAYGFTQPVLSVYYTSQSIIQAMPPDSPPLLQLPSFTRTAVKKIEDAALSEARKHITIQSFMDIPESRRRDLVKDAGISTTAYDAAVTVAKQLPRLVIEKTFFKVTGEKYVIPNSLVQFVVKARFIPPGTPNVPAVKPSDLEDVDPDESDPKSRRELEAETKQHQVPLAHAPYFARDHSPRWHLFLADARQGKIAVPPFTFTTFDKPILDEAGKPTFNVQTLKMQFQAPPQPGEYKFQMHLVCDSYVGFDDKREVVMVIEEPSKAEEVESDDEISEPEEDTIAGQMAALKGNQPAKPKRRPARVEELSDSGSDTEEEDEEEGDSDTDTDTDTDEE
ncbi:secretory subunit [Zalaria obscura]|uniref:Secretory subunit n=1 Tax=Zalaria obscura TaxID=2024903 RepID=A0ACC3SF19_9PEZI